MKKPILPDRTLALMQGVFANYPQLDKIVLFGSRATGKATERSDINLVTVGIEKRLDVGRISGDLEELPIPQICEVQAYERIRHEPLKQHIDTHGIVIYSREDDAEDAKSSRHSNQVPVTSA